MLTRRTRLAPFAAAILDAWLAERRLSELAGNLVFPASPSGRPMHKATMLRAVDALIDGAGIAESRASRASPQTLRNTFAADLFESGVEAELVGQWLGFVQAVSANRLYRAWQKWMDQQDSPAADAPDPAAPPLPAPRRDGRLTRKRGAGRVLKPLTSRVPNFLTFSRLSAIAARQTSCRRNDRIARQKSANRLQP